jgi:hypothetical protein
MRGMRPSDLTDVVVVSYAGDEHGDGLTAELVGRGVRVLRCSLAGLAETTITWQLGGSTQFDETTIPRGIASGIWRRPGNLELPSLDPRYADFATSESRDAFRGALLAADIRWLNSPQSLWRAEHKIVQLQAARDLGLPTAPTVVTNDPRSARRFLQDNLASVAKAVRYGLVATSPAPEFAWTSRVGQDDELEFGAIPTLLQAEVAAKEHLRVVTVGSEVFSYRLASSDLDWRATTENHALWELSRVDEFISDGARRLAAALDLAYTSQDWIVGMDNRAVFLEANPNGQWMFLEAASDQSITTAIADWLVSSSAAP